ncbi:hypothetical protein [Bifidobacterium choloepi]|uniref:Uncharacterized protein n=1 Tax=Bifidobacterium choloepi TaxID=2614131 RepID=A0A6I5MZJ5_9BIFI|nr:hypothetical protein [Bifidobacterium choloepi]NEG69727.1 hypothetical protein [Bifidobacterium choloepi]
MNWNKNLRVAVTTLVIVLFAIVTSFAAGEIARPAASASVGDTILISDDSSVAQPAPVTIDYSGTDAEGTISGATHVLTDTDFAAVLADSAESVDGIGAPATSAVELTPEATDEAAFDATIDETTGETAGGTLSDTTDSSLAWNDNTATWWMALMIVALMCAMSIFGIALASGIHLPKLRRLTRPHHHLRFHTA